MTLKKSGPEIQEEVDGTFSFLSKTKPDMAVKSIFCHTN
jgi:hypothetical protein